MATRDRTVVSARRRPQQATEATPNGEGQPHVVKVKPQAPGEAFKIVGVSRIGVRRINAMVYGPYGHGKTTWAASALDVPAMRDVLFIAAEPGDMSLTSRRDLDIIYVNKYNQIARIFDFLVKHCKYRDEGNIEKLLELERELKDTPVDIEDQTEPVEEGRTWFEEQRLRTGRGMDEPFMYRTVIVDSISEVHKYLVYKFTGVDIGKTKLDAEITKMEEWPAAQELFRLFVRSFRDLRMNSIFVSAESIEPAERNRKKNPLAGQSLPKLAGQSAGDIAGFVDIVGYLIREVGKDGDYVRRMYLGAGYEGFLSKHRFENLPDLDYIDNPSLTSLLDLARKDAEADGTRQELAEARRSPVSDSSQRGVPSRSPGIARSGRRAGRGNSVRRHG
jgi:hypothetical protein